MSGGGTPLPEGMSLRPGGSGAAPLMDAYARIDELAAERDEALARADDFEAWARAEERARHAQLQVVSAYAVARIAAAEAPLDAVQAAAARLALGLALRQVGLCDDPECEPCTLGQAALCGVDGEAADDVLAALAEGGWEVRRVR